MSRRVAPTQAAIGRALKEAAKIGALVEIAGDGTIRIDPLRERRQRNKEAESDLAKKRVIQL